MSGEKAEWVPKMDGSTTAYLPEYRLGSYVDGELRWEKWRDIPTTDGNGAGVPYPAPFGGLFKTLGLYGFEQAQALAWQFQAEAAARAVKAETRVVTYEFVYSLKARRVSE